MTDPLGTPQTRPDLWEVVIDEAEQAFTLSMPRGWTRRARLSRQGATVHTVVSATRPDGRIVLFTGDPSIPMFVEPAQAPFGPMPGTVLRSGTSIEHFLPEWAHRRFASLPGFRILGMSPSPPLLSLVTERARRASAPLAWATAGRLRFVFRDGDSHVHGLVLGATVGLGMVWLAQLHGVTAVDGDPEPYEEALLALVGSEQATGSGQQRVDAERARNDASHRATMASIARNTASLQQAHQQNMASIQASGDAHQARMATLHASFDSANAAWQARQHEAPAAAVDDGGAHRRFLNLIAEERTVVDGEGATHQVRDGYDRYFYRRSDNTWIGTRAHEDLRAIPGIDPNDFEEMRIRR